MKEDQLKVGDRFRVVDYAPTKERGVVKKLQKNGEVLVQIDGKPKPEVVHISCLQKWESWMAR